MTVTNPYLQDQANAITDTATQNLNTNILPGVNSGAMAAGGYGGSRQGIAQGLAIGQTNQGITNSLAGLYGNAYATDQQIQAQKDMQAGQLSLQQQIANMQNQTTRDLGFGNLGLGSQTANQNFYTQQRGLDLSQAGLGASLMTQGNQGLTGQGQQLYQAGQTEQQAPYNILSQYGGMLSPFTGLNSSSSSSTPGASTIGSALGGGLTAAQLWQLLTKQGG